MLSIGGQELHDGVLLLTPTSIAVAVSGADGKPLADKLERKPVGKSLRRLLAIPLLRGLVNLFLSLSCTLRGVGLAARLRRKAGLRPSLAPLWGVLLLILFTAALYGAERLAALCCMRLAPAFAYPVDVLLTFTVLITGLLLVRLLPPIRRLLRFHGAEHMLIHIYEAGLPLIVEAAQTQSRFHKRCGTTLTMGTLLVLLVVSLLLPPNMNETLSSLILLGVTLLALMGIGEAQRAKKETLPVRLGLWAQRYTTLQPQREELCGALTALLTVLGREETYK